MDSDQVARARGVDAETVGRIQTTNAPMATALPHSFEALVVAPMANQCQEFNLHHHLIIPLLPLRISTVPFLLQTKWRKNRASELIDKVVQSEVWNALLLQ